MTGNPDQKLRSAIMALIDHSQIDIVFQPIVDLTSAEIIGHEALMRPGEGAPFEGPLQMLDAAATCGVGQQLEIVAMREAVKAARCAENSVLLFLNNSPDVFASEGYAAVLEALQGVCPNAQPHRLVLEITERTDESIIPDLCAQTLALREQGYRIAMDDVGAGVNGLNQIMMLRPNWIKLDLELIRDIDFDPMKQNLIRLFVHFAKLGNMSLIAEGIERDEQLAVLVDLGVSHGQGYLLGRPGAMIKSIAPAVRTRITELRQQFEQGMVHDPRARTIGPLATPALSLDQSATVETACRQLDKMPQQKGVVIFDGARCLGWMSRPELLGDQPKSWRAEDHLGDLPIHECLVVEIDTTLTRTLELLAGRSDENLHLPVIVLRSGRVNGVVRIQDLLRNASDDQRRIPSHVSSLTGLPSRVQADRWLASRIRSRSNSIVAMIDLKGFNHYNAAYGFDKGDDMLVRLVGQIKTQLVDSEDGATFFAHLGADRFLLAFDQEAEERLLALAASFTATRSEFFSSIDVATQSFRVTDPSGQMRMQPLTAMRIVYLPGVLKTVSDPRDVYEIANQLSLRDAKSEASAEPRLLRDRREPDAASSD